jgi:Caudovirus prohead serine protease
MADFNVFLPISKVDTEKRMVWGYASTPSKDLQGEIVTLDAIKAALPDYMQWRNIREMHTSSAVGSAVEATVDEKGLYIGAKIRDDAAWAKCQETSKGANDQVYRGFSIGGSKLQKVGDTIKELRLTEISLVDRPANPDCRIDFAKGDFDIFAEVEKENPASNESFFKKSLDTVTELFRLATGAAPAEGESPLVKGNEAKPNPDELTADELSDMNLKLAECDFEKREFSEKQRKHLASSGAALPDGSFPISSTKDLENAVHAAGRASDYAKAKAHIIARAKTLNATHLLPADWPGSSKQEKTVMDELQKRLSEAHKGHIAKAKHHIAKAIDEHGKAVGAFNDMAKCMGKAEENKEHEKHMRKLGSHLESMADHHDLAMHHLGKAEAGSSSTGSSTGEASLNPKEGSEVSPVTRESITIHPQPTMTEGRVEGSTYSGAGDSPYSAAAVAAEVQKAVAAAVASAVTPLQEKLTKVTEDNAFMKGQMAVIERQPSGGPRPVMFNTRSDGHDLLNTRDPAAEANKVIGKAYGNIREDDPDGAAAEISRIIGTRAANPRLFGKSIMDAEYTGSVGKQ